MYKETQILAEKCHNHNWSVWRVRSINQPPLRAMPVWGALCPLPLSRCEKCATDIEMLMASVQLFHHLSKWTRPCVCVWSPAPPSLKMRSPERITLNSFHEYVTTSDSVFVTEGHHGSKSSTMRLLYWGSERRRQASLYKTLRVIEMDPPYLVLTINFLNCGYVLCPWKQQ